MSEDALWNKVRDDLGPWGVLVRIENSLDGGASGGTADVAYVLRAGMRRDAPIGSGWIELKHEARWPVLPRTPFTIKSLQLEQVQFALDWRAAGGRAWFLLQVGRGYWLLDPPTAYLIFQRRLLPTDVRAAAVAGSTNRLPVGDVLRALTR